LADPKTPFHRQLYAQTLAAIALGALFGAIFPAQADALWVKSLGDGFVKLVKMTIAPVIFCTVAGGIAHLSDARKVGRVGVKALVYFEIVSTFSLVLGLFVGELVQPGVGFPGRPDAAAVEQYAKRASESLGAVDFLLGVIPDTIFGAFSQGQILQVLFVAILFGFSLMPAGEKTERLRVFLDDAGHATFGVVGIIMKAAPIGAFGAMAYTVGHYGLASLASLAWLVGSFYLASALFVVLALGVIGVVLSLGTWIQSSFGLRPLKMIRDQLARVHSGADARLTGRFPSEIEPLVSDLNTLLARQEDLVRRARERAGDLAHGLKTPLTILQIEARNAEQRLSAVQRNQAGKITDVLEVEKEITRVRGEIEQMESERKNLTGRVEFATINVKVTEESETTGQGAKAKEGAAAANATNGSATTITTKKPECQPGQKEKVAAAINSYVQSNPTSAPTVPLAPAAAAPQAEPAPAPVAGGAN